MPSGASDPGAGDRPILPRRLGRATAAAIVAIAAAENHLPVVGHVKERAGGFARRHRAATFCVGFESAFGRAYPTRWWVLIRAVT